VAQSYATCNIPGLHEVSTMALIADFFLIPPEQWLFPTHGDVSIAKARAAEYIKLKGVLDGADHQIEEFVRQWALKQLLSIYK